MNNVIDIRTRKPVAQTPRSSTMLDFLQNFRFIDNHGQVWCHTNRLHDLLTFAVQLDADGIPGRMQQEVVHHRMNEPSMTLWIDVLDDN